MVVFALQLSKEDLNSLTEEGRQEYEGLTYREVKQIQTFIMKQRLQASDIWPHSRPGVAPSRSGRLWSVLVLAVRGHPLPKADEIERIRKKCNMSGESSFTRLFR